jgi:hypothetical protein
MDEDTIVFSEGDERVSNIRVGCWTLVILTGAYLAMFKILVQSVLIPHVDL